MRGAVASLYRYPLKGFSPERLRSAALKAGRGLAFDRFYAVEDGPSGFDPAEPKFISKQRFTVLAKIPEVAAIRTRFEDASGQMRAEALEAPPFDGSLDDAASRARFAAWLTGVLGEKANGPLKVLEAPGAHRFYDDEEGFLSLINLASVADLEQRLGARIDPLRFRANLYVSGWPAWAELEGAGKAFQIGDVKMRGHKPIRRCTATHVNPDTAERDVEIVPALMREYGHAFCGLYLHVEQDGLVHEGDEAVSA